VELEYETFEWKLRICTGHVHKEMFLPKYKQGQRITWYIKHIFVYSFLTWCSCWFCGIPGFLG